MKLPDFIIWADSSTFSPLEKSRPSAAEAVPLAGRSLTGHVRIYNRVLSADEIKRLYKIGGGR